MNEKITDKARGMFEKATGYIPLYFGSTPLLPFHGFHVDSLMALYGAGKNAKS